MREASNLSECLLKTLNDNEYNDIKIVLDDGEIHANKFILVSRSEYFKTMFSSSFQESTKGTVAMHCKVLVMNKIIR